MAHLFDAGMALRSERFEGHDVREETGAGADIFVGAAAAAELGRDASACDALSLQGAGRWVLPVFGAMALHLLLLALLLLAPKRELILPALDAAQGRVITISLVEMPDKAGTIQSSAPLPPAPAAVHKRPATPKQTRRSPKVLKVQPPAPQPSKPMVAEAVALDGVSDIVAPVEARTSAERSSGGDNGASQAEGGASLQASAPLYGLNPPPVYPAVARRREMEGTVMLSVLVDCEGKAAQIKLQRGSGHEVLDRSALECVRRWRFAPARHGGRAQEMWVRVPVRFQLQ